MEKIKKFSELISMKSKGEYELDNDIDCKGVKIDALFKDDFKGCLDGKGYKVYNLIISEEVWRDCQPISLIHEMKKAIIKNIKFENIVFEVNPSVYKPEIAALCVKCINSKFENVVCDIQTTNNKEIPMIYESSNSSIKDSSNICNNKKTKLVLYDL